MPSVACLSHRIGERWGLFASRHTPSEFSQGGGSRSCDPELCRRLFFWTLPPSSMPFAPQCVVVARPTVCGQGLSLLAFSDRVRLPIAPDALAPCANQRQTCSAFLRPLHRFGGAIMGYRPSSFSPCGASFASRALLVGVVCGGHSCGHPRRLGRIGVASIADGTAPAMSWPSRAKRHWPLLHVFAGFAGVRVYPSHIRGSYIARAHSPNGISALLVCSSVKLGNCAPCGVGRDGRGRHAGQRRNIHHVRLGGRTVVRNAGVGFRTKRGRAAFSIKRPRFALVVCSSTLLVALQGKSALPLRVSGPALWGSPKVASPHWGAVCQHTLVTGAASADDAGLARKGPSDGLGDVVVFFGKPSVGQGALPNAQCRFGMPPKSLG